MNKTFCVFKNAIAISIFLVNCPAIFSQTLQPAKFKVEKPAVVNFSQLADYELTHPVMMPKRFIEQGEDREKKFSPVYGPVPADAKQFNVSTPDITTRGVSPAPKIVFDGIQDEGFLIPPDINGVASEDFIFETTNQQFTIYHKDGSRVETLNIGTFFKPANGNGYYDPHVLYDALRKRFIVCIDGFSSSGAGELFVAVSQTSDPTQAWYVYGIPGQVSANDLLDYPAMGYNQKWIVLTANDFQNFAVPTKIYAFSRDSVYNGKSITVSLFTDGSIFSLLPVATVDSTQENEYMVLTSTPNSNGFGYVKLYTISGDEGSPVYTPGASIGVNQPWSTHVLNAPQLGSSERLEVIDSRIENGIFQNGSLWFTHDVFVPATAPSHSAVDWWQVDPAADTLQQFGRIEDPTGATFYFYPSIGVNKENDVMVGYSVSSPTMFPGSGYSFRQHSDPVNTMENGIVFKNGEASYFKDFGSGRNRWGDFTFTCSDPADNSFWTFQEYAGTSNRWATVVANAAGIPCSGKPDVGTISSLNDTLCYGTKTMLSLVGNSAGVAGIDYSWQQSTNGTDWVPAENGTDNSILETANLFIPTYFRCTATCSNSGKSQISAPKLVELGGFIQPPANQTICNPQQVVITANSNTSISWFNSLVSSAPIATGDTLIANITSDTTFYASTGSKSFYSAGITDSSTSTGFYFPNMNDGLEFSAFSEFILDTVFVYTKAAGNVTVNLLDNLSGAVLASATVAVSDSEAGKKKAVPLFFSVPGFGDYKLTASGSTVGSMWRNTSDVAFPYAVPGVLQINRSSDLSTSTYYFFYDWRVASGCGVEKVPAHIDLDTVKFAFKASHDSLCSGAGQSDTLTVSGASTYVWQPGNVSGNVLVVSPTQTSTYSVTGTDAFGCVGTDSFTVRVTDCTSGIKPVRELSGVEVFPNPAHNSLNVQVESPGNLTYTVSVSNLLGINLINLGGIHFTPGRNLSVDLSSLPAGMYYVSVESNGKKWMQPFNKF